MAIVATATLAGLALLQLATPSAAIAAWITEAPGSSEARILIVIWGLTAAITGPALAAAFYLARLARQVVRDERFPPAGMRVVRDTPILRGAAARRRARVMQVVAAGLVGVGFCFALAVLLLSVRLR
jgi:hypothetical protein